MTCVSGHLTKLDFGPEFSNWSYPPPESLFDGPVQVTIGDVGLIYCCCCFVPNRTPRKIKPFPPILNAKHGELRLSSSGPIVIARESI
jgi:hypothetical protein